MSAHKHSLIGRAWRFGTVGLVTAFIHTGVLAIGVEILSWSSTVATSVGFTAAVVVNYLLHYRWTFGGGSEMGQAPHGMALIRYSIMIACGFSINLAVMHVGVSVMHWHYFPTQILAVVLVVAWNFILANTWVFSIRGS